MKESPGMPRQQRDEPAKLNLRMSTALQKRVSRDAEERGISMNAAIIARLEQAFLYGGAELEPLFRQISSAVEIIESQRGERWLKNYETFIAVVAALKSIL